MRYSMLIVSFIVLSGLAVTAHAQKAAITQIQSARGTIGITNPTGPTTTIDVRIPLPLVQPPSSTTLTPPSTAASGIVTAVSNSTLLAVYGQGNQGIAVHGRSFAPTPISLGEFPVPNEVPSGVLGENYNRGGVGVKGVGGASGFGWGVLGEGVTGVKGLSITGSGVEGTGIAGVYGVGVQAGSTGVFGMGEPGVKAYSVNGYGVFAEGGDIGVYAHNLKVTGNVAYLGSQCCAGDFYGNVNISGTLSKSAGSLKIDHPLEPTKKYLYHSFVESPDMMNLYNGNVTLDASGEAWVELPTWFEALNQEFRYQLTALGAPGPNLYVAQEIVGNRFRIAGGSPKAKVSWLVTGIRHDVYANAHRIPVEEDKPLAEAGTYLHPDLYAQNPQRGVEFAMHPEARQRLIDAAPAVAQAAK